MTPNVWRITEQAIDSVIHAAHHALAQVRAENGRLALRYSPVEFAKQFATCHVGFARRTGHSTYIAQHFSPNDVVITPNGQLGRAMMALLSQRHCARDRVFSMSDPESMRSFHFKAHTVYPSTIWVDDANLISSPQIIYSTFVDPRIITTQLFVFLH